jgi:2'-5' RNA ligase/N-acetylglutamate synthase-like GNAT family acetyltransferase
MPKARLGVVVLLPERVSTEVDGLRRGCGDAALGMVPPHITLVPPINVRAADLDAAVAVVRRAATVVDGPLAFELGPPATFAPLTPVLYLSVGGDVERLAAVRQAVLAGPLEREAEWDFVPHVTLATEQPAERLAAAVTALADYRATVTVERLFLLREGEDRVWRPLADAPFGPPIVVGRGGLPVELAVTEILEPAGLRFLAEAGEGGGQTESAAADGRGDRSFAVVARREGAVVAVASGTAGQNATLDRLVVAADVRRQGLGAHVLAAVEQRAALLGSRRLTAAIEAGGPAQTFFTQRGWTVERTPSGEASSGATLRMVHRLAPA